MDAGTRIVIAVISHRGRLLMQLRDFLPAIADPGMWGFFGGHLQSSETPDAGMRRELLEELGWSPPELEPLGAFESEGLQIIGFKAERAADPSALILGEGQELGVFDTLELATGAAHSRRWGRTFPLTGITRKALSIWSLAGDSQRAGDPVP